MKYKYKIHGLSQSGNPNVSFTCVHCGLMDMYMDGYLYTANLRHDPHTNMTEACVEFLECVNSGKYDIFNKHKTGLKLRQSLCHCDPKVIDIEYHKATLRAKSILQRGMEKLSKS